MVRRRQSGYYGAQVEWAAEADGGGFAIEYPDLPGCISDGETLEKH